MTLETDDDRLTYLEAFGVPVRIRGQLMQAVFDNDYLGAQAGDLEIESRVPMITCLTSDVERLVIVKDDQVDGLDKPYRVDHHEPDGTGMSRLVLKD